MTAPKPTRKDALDNRERILDVAREALAASGDASLTAIAKRAGVGIGTLYRHFPTRESLILELYSHDIQRLIDLAPAPLAAHPPLDAMRGSSTGWLKSSTPRRTMAGLLDSGAAAGVFKSGLDPEDVLLQLSVLWRIDPARGGDERAARILGLIVDGLQSR